MAQVRGASIFELANMPVFPIGVVITGLLVAGLGLLPSGDWVYRLFRSQLHREPRVLRNKNPYRH